MKCQKGGLIFSENAQNFTENDLPSNLFTQLRKLVAETRFLAKNLHLVVDIIIFQLSVKGWASQKQINLGFGGIRKISKFSCFRPALAHFRLRGESLELALCCTNELYGKMAKNLMNFIFS